MLGKHPGTGVRAWRGMHKRTHCRCLPVRLQATDPVWVAGPRLGPIVSAHE
jgi:hypothetical protein